MIEYPKPITKNCIKTIFEHMNNSIYLFNESKDKSSICFFTHIKFRNETIPVMISNSRIFNENFLANNNKITIRINNLQKSIEFGDTKYINKNYDLSIIEINEEKSDKIYYLELDEKIYEEEPELYYDKETIFIINKNKENDNLVSFGFINRIYNSEIDYFSYQYIIKEFWPIFNSFNNKLIGIYKCPYKYYNKGILLTYIIKEFINDYKLSKKTKNEWNEIDIHLSIDEKSVNKKIYFLNNNVYGFNKDLQRLNKSNTILTIKYKKFEYKIENDELENFFSPGKKGNYTINIKFNINLTDCSFLFAGCKYITSINFISFNTNYIKSMQFMFHRCTMLKSVNLLSLDTKYVTNMGDMFSFCENLEYLDLSSFNTQNITNMNYMFYYCYNLKSLILPSLNPIKIIDMDCIFEMCNKLNLPFFDTANNNASNKYENEINIKIKVNKNDLNKKIYFLDNEEYKNLKAIKHSSLKELNLLNTKLYIGEKKHEFKKYFIPKFEGEYNIKLRFNIYLTDCSYMFFGCTNIIDINFDSFNAKYVKNMKKMFFDCNSVKDINFFNFNTLNSKNMSYMFSDCINLTDLNLSSFFTKNVTHMNHMFNNCKELKNIYLSSFDTENVTNMSNMFSNCENLTELNLSSFNTKNVTNMSIMFYNCYKLKELNLSNFDTQNVTNMSSMFYNCNSLVNLNLSSFKTQKVTSMSWMFYGCNNLVNLDLSSFDSKNITSMVNMFSGCKNLINLNISSFNISKNVDISNLFKDCVNLENLNLLPSNSDNMRISKMFSDNQKMNKNLVERKATFDRAKSYNIINSNIY